MCTISRTRRILTSAIVLSLAWPIFPAAAQGDKPIRLIVPNAPGSSVDAVARTVGNQMSRLRGQSVVVENFPGAGGTSGTAQVVRAPKDGLTLGMVSNNHVINPSIYKSMPFDTIKDITPITIIASTPMVLVAHPSVQAKNLQELVALAKASPGELTYGSSGNGTILHLAGEALQHQAGIKLKHIPYRGTGQQTTDLLGGQIQLAFMGVTGAAPHIKSGKLRAIGVSTTVASAILPEVPPLAQQGLPNYNLQGWIALIGPAGLSPLSVSRIHADVKELASTKEAQDALAAQGFISILSDPGTTQQTFKTEMAQYASLVRQSGMTID